MLMMDKDASPNDMLSANHAGRILGVSGKTVIRLMEEGKITGYRIGIAHKFRRGDVEQYLEDHKFEAKPKDE